LLNLGRQVNDPEGKSEQAGAEVADLQQLLHRPVDPTLRESYLDSHLDWIGNDVTQTSDHKLDFLAERLRVSVLLEVWNLPRPPDEDAQALWAEYEPLIELARRYPARHLSALRFFAQYEGLLPDVTSYVQTEVEAAAVVMQAETEAVSLESAGRLAWQQRAIAERLRRDFNFGDGSPLEALSFVD